MAEPLVFYAELNISRKGFGSWLALPFSAGGGPPVRILDYLAEALAAAFDPVTGNYLLCRHDKAEKQLQFAVCLADGSSAAATALEHTLQEMLQGVSTCLPKRKSRLAEAAGPVVRWPLAPQAEDPQMPAWLAEWLQALPALAGPESQKQWLDREILTRLDSINRIARATPENPERIGWLYTDGSQVYANVAGKTIMEEDPAAPGGWRYGSTEAVGYVQEGANPRTCRALADSYYTDGNLLWYCNIFSGNPPQALAWCEGLTPQTYRFDCDIDTLVTLGDRAWSEAFDDDKPPHERLYLKCTEIDGASFTRTLKSIDCDAFSDRLRQYRMDSRTGLQVVDDVNEA